MYYDLNEYTRIRHGAYWDVASCPELSTVVVSNPLMPFGVAILTVSDTASVDSSTDKSGPLLQDLLASAPNNAFKVVENQIVPDERSAISAVVRKWSKSPSVDWIITSGGTGFGIRDCTPEVRHLTSPPSCELSRV